MKNIKLCFFVISIIIHLSEVSAAEAKQHALMPKSGETIRLRADQCADMGQGLDPSAAFTR